VNERAVRDDPPPSKGALEHASPSERKGRRIALKTGPA
jgi:hypothetical protein